MIIKEFTYPFDGIDGYPSKCHIRIIDDKDANIVVVCSQGKNCGTSITNYFEVLFFKIKEYLKNNMKDVVNKKKIDSLIWIEHYSALASLKQAPVYSIVSYKLDNNPTWNYASLEALAEYSGHNIEELDVPCEIIDAI